MESLYRSAICKVDILSGGNVLKEGQSLARNLYNFARYCTVGFNRKLAKARGHSSLAGKLPKYTGYIGMWKSMYDTDEYRVLNDRVSNYVLRGLDASMRSWFGNIKRNPEARPPRHLDKDKFPPMTFEIGRNAKYAGGGIYRLTVLSVSNDNRHVMVKIYLPPQTNHDCVESIKYLSDGRVAVSYRLKPKEAIGDGVVGIDLGVNRLATVAFADGNSMMYTASGMLSDQAYWLKRQARCMPSGYRGRGDGRRLPKSNRTKRYWAMYSKRKRLALHNISTHIVNDCHKRGIGTIAIGDLKNIREDKDFGAVTNQKLHLWPFNELTRMITYKAEEVGIEVIKISERYTSRTCSVCGFVNNPSARKHRGLLVCASCGAATHADVNGARNILQKYLLSRRDDAVGVAGGLPTLPSTVTHQGMQGNGEFAGLANQPTFVARLDLRNFAVKMTRIYQQKRSVATDTSTEVGV